MSFLHDVAIVGVAESDIGKVPHLNPMDITVQAAMRALDDAGLKKENVDGLFSASAYYQMSTLSLAEYMGIEPSYMDGTNIGESSFISHVAHAAMAISEGLCEVALVAYGSTQRTDGGFVSSTEEFAFEDPFGHLYPISSYALATERYMYEYGMTRDQLSEVAVSARKWASLNERAKNKTLITHADVANSTLISSPLRLLDCCLVTDGGAALVLTSKERAMKLNQKPVYIWGYGEATDLRRIMSMPDVTKTSAVASGRRAYEMAGVASNDIDVLELYDAFSINVLLFLEDLGFCQKGEAGRFIENGKIGPNGTLPVNTNGGGLSYCHPGMYGLFLLVEAVQQLRGRCGKRQVANANRSLVHGNGGVLSSQVTMILSNEEK